MDRDDPLTEGWSIHELGTARMGTDPKTSVLNSFQQSHDVKNLFVVDGSSLRERVLPEPDLDDHGPGLALLRPPGRRAAEGEPVTTSPAETALKLTAAGAAVPLLPGAATPPAAAATAAAGRFFSARRRWRSWTS